MTQRKSTRPIWSGVKSSMNFTNSICVEAAHLNDMDVGIRDSKDHRDVLRFTPISGRFLAGARSGEFDTFAYQLMLDE
jgi:hypothetical protein